MRKIEILQREDIKEEYLKILDELDIDESIVGIDEMGDRDIIISTELRVIRYNKKTKETMWKHDFHRDVIIRKKIRKDKISITEFDGKEYIVDIKTGKCSDPRHK